MWTNGGPGASSFLGAFTELGPYYLSDASLRTEAYRKTGIPSLFENVFRWTKLGSVLIRNLPPPVGFSYCDPAGPNGAGHSCGSWNDTKTARHSLTFMENWFAAFPEFAKLDLFLAGESYAGLYVPMLAREMLASSSPVAQQLRGILVGDGCLGGPGNKGGCIPAGGLFFSIQFFHGHGQFSDKTYAEIQYTCAKEELMNGVTSPACKAVLDRMSKEIGYSFAYNLYDECYDFALQNIARWDEPRHWWGPMLPQQGPLNTASSQEGSESYRKNDGSEMAHMDGSPCGGTAVLPVWVNHSEVRRALHVAEDAVFFTGDNGRGFTYNVTEPSLLPWYRKVIESGRLRVLIYNGDTDPGLNSFFAQDWTSAVGIPELESWRPWTRDGRKRIGGYVTRYANSFDFLTIRGAGHMVPEYKPEAAFVMLRSFLRQEDYPRYHTPSPNSWPQALLKTTADINDTVIMV